MAGESARTLHVEVVTPYRIFFDGPAEMVIITCKDGEIGILPDHAPLVAALVPGEIRLKIDGRWLAAAAANGYAEIGPEAMMIVVSAAEWPDEIDVSRAEQALRRAEARMRFPGTSSQEMIRSRHGAERARARKKVARKFAPAIIKVNQPENGTPDRQTE